MKSPRLKHLRVNKKIRLKDVRKIERDIEEIIQAGLRDIRWYIKKDIMAYLKKRGVLYVTKKSSKKKKRRR